MKYIKNFKLFESDNWDDKKGNYEILFNKAKAANDITDIMDASLLEDLTDDQIRDLIKILRDADRGDLISKLIKLSYCKKALNKYIGKTFNMQFGMATDEPLELVIKQIFLRDPVTLDKNNKPYCGGVTIQAYVNNRGNRNHNDLVIFDYSRYYPSASHDKNDDKSFKITYMPKNDIHHDRNVTLDVLFETMDDARYIAEIISLINPHSKYAKVERGTNNMGLGLAINKD